MDSEAFISVWLIKGSTAYPTTMARAVDRMKGLCCPRDFSSFERAEEALGGTEHTDVLLGVGLPGLDRIPGKGYRNPRDRSLDERNRGT